MGNMLAALLKLQSIESKLATVKSRLRVRQGAVNAQQRRINEVQEKYQAVHDHVTQLRKESDTLALDLKIKEERVVALRAALNTAKSNKEYAAILTEINTIKADNAKYEEQAMSKLQEIETLNGEAGKVKALIEEEQKRMEEILKNNAEEIEKLNRMNEKLLAERKEAATEVPAAQLKFFERISSRFEGDAMAQIEVQGDRPPFRYQCGGCYMSLNAEHANALRTRDEIRTCDSCGRILFLENNPA